MRIGQESGTGLTGRCFAVGAGRAVLRRWRPGGEENVLLSQDSKGKIGFMWQRSIQRCPFPGAGGTAAGGSCVEGGSGRSRWEKLLALAGLDHREGPHHAVAPRGALVGPDFWKPLTAPRSLSVHRSERLRR